MLETQVDPATAKHEDPSLDTANRPTISGQLSEASIKAALQTRFHRDSQTGYQGETPIPRAPLLNPPSIDGATADIKPIETADQRTAQQTEQAAAQPAAEKPEDKQAELLNEIFDVRFITEPISPTAQAELFQKISTYIDAGFDKDQVKAYFQQLPPEQQQKFLPLINQTVDTIKQAQELVQSLSQKQIEENTDEITVDENTDKVVDQKGRRLPIWSVIGLVLVDAALFKGYYAQSFLETIVVRVAKENTNNTLRSWGFEVEDGPDLNDSSINAKLIEAIGETKLAEMIKKIIDTKDRDQAYGLLIALPREARINMMSGESFLNKSALPRELIDGLLTTATGVEKLEDLATGKKQLDNKADQEMQRLYLYDILIKRLQELTPKQTP